MNLKKPIIGSITRLRELWKIKIFKYSIIIHLLYFIVATIITLTFFRDRNDFAVYYEVGKTFVKDINNLYNLETRWPFRYFPLSAVLFVPFYLLGFNIGFIIFNLINLILNILICVILYKIIILVRRKEKEDKRVITYISLFLMGIPQIFNYILGQINLYVTLLILISFLIYFKYDRNRWQFIASLLLGISIIIKPITIFMIPFIILIRYDYNMKKLNLEFKKTILRIVGVLLPLSLNIFIFLILPSLLKGFIEVNFIGEDTIYINHSFSLTKVIENFLYFIGVTEEQLLNVQLLIFLSVLGVLGGFGFLIYLFRRRNSSDLIYGYTFGILIMLLSYYDSWDHHLLILIPFLIIIIFNLTRNSQLTKNFIKPSLYFFSFFDLAFMGIWFLGESIFPINFVPTIFLILVFYALFKYCLAKNSF